MILMLYWLAPVIAVVGLALVGCGSADDPAGSGGTAVAAFYPLGWVAEQVGGDRVDVDLLTSPGVEPHDLELSPQQVAAVADADLLVVEHGFQPAVDEAVDAEADGTLVDAAEVVDLLPADEDGDVDPHFWLDPTRLAVLAESVGDAYGEADPEHADGYDAAAADLVTRLRALDEEYRRSLADCRTSTVVTSHDAFGYLADRYGLRIVPIAGLDPANEPSPERLADLVDLVETSGVRTVFTEPLVSPAVAETLVDETGLQTATLDPIEGLSDETAEQDYLSLMRSNLAALVQANGC